jgi:serine/threonine kinase 38
MEEKDGGWKGAQGVGGCVGGGLGGLGGGGLMVNQAEAFKTVLATAQDGMGGLDVGSGEGRAAGNTDGLPVDDNLASSITRQKVAAAKQYIENHYKSQMKSLQERKER